MDTKVTVVIQMRIARDRLRAAQAELHHRYENALSKMRDGATLEDATNYVGIGAASDAVKEAVDSYTEAADQLLHEFADVQPGTTLKLGVEK